MLATVFTPPLQLTGDHFYFATNPTTTVLGTMPPEEQLHVAETRRAQGISLPKHFETLFESVSEKIKQGQGGITLEDALKPVEDITEHLRFTIDLDEKPETVCGLTFYSYRDRPAFVLPAELELPTDRTVDKELSRSLQAWYGSAFKVIHQANLLERATEAYAAMRIIHARNGGDKGTVTTQSMDSAAQEISNLRARMMGSKTHMHQATGHIEQALTAPQ